MICVIGIMSWSKLLFWLFPRRLRSSWGLLAITSFGILAAVTMMATGAIYSRALAEGGLRHLLASTSPMVLDAQVIVRNRPLGPADYQRLHAAVEETINERLGYMLEGAQRYGRIQPHLALAKTLEERSPPADAPLGQPFFLTEFAEHAQLVEGRWPRAIPSLHAESTALEMVVGRKTASSMGFKVGSQVYLFPFRDDPSERIALNVVGIAEPEDSREEYWMGGSSAYFQVYDLGERRVVPIYLPEEAFFSGLGSRYPSLVADYGWLVFLDTSALSAGTVGPTIDAVAGLEIDINKRFPRSFVFSGLDNALEDYEEDLSHARVPLFLFISLVVFVILYFLALVMGLLARIGSAEASLFKSRGAGILQVGGLLALGEGVAALLAIALGPLLALGIVRYLLLSTIQPVEGGAALSVGFSGDMFIMGAVGGLLSIVVLVASGIGRARLGIVEYLRVRARPPTLPFLHRYYVDLLVLVALGLVWWQVHGRGGFIEADPSLLFGPVLALLAAAFLFLRLLPIILRAMAWAGSVAPAWVSFALIRVARDPLPHGSLAIILMMAIALGLVGAAFQSTLSRSEREQALYDVGGEVVIRGSSFSVPFQQELAGLPGVHGASPLSRESVILLEGFSGTSTTLLAVDPETLPQNAWFRDDFAGKSLSALLAPLGQLPEGPGGVLLPGDAERIGVWAKDGNTSQSLISGGPRLWMRVSDATGRYHSLPLSPVSSSSSNSTSDEVLADATADGWTFFEAALPGVPDGGEPQAHRAEPPFRLVSIFIVRGARLTRQPGGILLDDITIKGPGEASPASDLVIESYEDPGGWAPLPNEGAVADTLKRDTLAARTGRFGLNFSWEEPLARVPRGIVIPPGPFPLPAIGGPTFHRGQELLIKQTGAGQAPPVPLVVRDVTDYFPTLRPSSRPFLLVSLDHYGQYVEGAIGGKLEPPGELWLSLEESAQRGQAILSIRELLPRSFSIRDRAAEVEQAQRNPLAGGGWDGLTILSTAALTLAVVLSLGVYTAFLLQSGRVDLAVARAMGFSRGQLVFSLGLERIVVAVLGIGAGSAVGLWLGRWVLGFLDVTASGRSVVPPMIVTMHDGLVVLVFVGVVLALAIASVAAGLLAGRQRAPDILRTG